MKIVKIWLTDTVVWIRTDDGREACEEFSKYHRLRAASQEQRLTYRQSEEGLHWDELGEDLSFEVFFDTKPTTALYNFFMRHSELNASAIARRLGLSQDLSDKAKSITPLVTGWWALLRLLRLRTLSGKDYRPPFETTIHNGKYSQISLHIAKTNNTAPRGHRTATTKLSCQQGHPSVCSHSHKQKSPAASGRQQGK